MPGMLDTVLDVGCTAGAVHGLIRRSGHPRFAWDCRRRFLESYASVVLGLDAAPFAAALAGMVAAESAAGERALAGAALERLALGYRQLVEDEDVALSDDPFEQLETAAQAVYRSWMSPRACTYRRLQKMDDLEGTAVTVQAMVFGNRNLSSGAGVAFSRDPSTGAPEPIIEVLFGAQGEDVVSGTSTPETGAALAEALPAVFAELHKTLTLLEGEFADVQDVEFTIEDGKLWILQTRAAKRTPLAALRFAVEFVREGLIAPPQALQRVAGIALDSLAWSRFAAPGAPAAHGIAA
jgi:pyruvate,orthophosphate dikinase